MTKLPKTRCSIVEIMGDFYYKMMPINKVIDVVFKVVSENERLYSQEEIDDLVSKNINIPFPLNQPQYELLWQDSYQDGKHSIMIWK